LTGMAEWRREHPRATLAEIERELDARFARLRAGVLEHLAEETPAADWGGVPAGEGPKCPDCGVGLQRRGRHRRELRTTGDEPLRLDRQYGVCPRCERGFFPSG
jgi:hypothetical protein